MPKKTVDILPATQDILNTMGEQIKLARLRRNLSVELVAERADISRATLWKVEKGDKTVAIGIYAAVLHALNGMDNSYLSLRSQYIALYQFWLAHVLRKCYLSNIALHLYHELFQHPLVYHLNMC